MILQYDTDTKFLTIQLRNETSVLRSSYSNDITLDLSMSGSVVGIEVFQPSTSDWRLREILSLYQIDFQIADALLKLENHKYIFQDI